MIQSSEYPDHPDDRTRPAVRHRLDRADVVISVGLVLLLMGFSIIAMLFREPILTALAGTACVSLSGQIARRLLARPSLSSSSGRSTLRPPSRPAPRGRAARGA